MKRNLMGTALLAVLAAGCTSARSEAPADAEGKAILVYKNPACGCCGKWIDHMREHGFVVEVRDVADLREIKATAGVPQELSSCHTAIVDGYAVEGHVPADVILRLLEERPPVAGLAVPGMPAGSPGMEMEGVAPRRYDIVAFDRAGRATVFDSR